MQVELARVGVRARVSHREHAGPGVLQDEVFVAKRATPDSVFIGLVVLLIKCALASRTIMVLQNKRT
jgi:hypothetical protein